VLSRWATQKSEKTTVFQY